MSTDLPKDTTLHFEMLSFSCMIIDDSDSDGDSDNENDVLIGCLRGDIVGLQYYRGTVFLSNVSHYES